MRRYTETENDMCLQTAMTDLTCELLSGRAQAYHALWVAIRHVLPDAAGMRRFPWRVAQPHSTPHYLLSLQIREVSWPRRTPLPGQVPEAPRQVPLVQSTSLPCYLPELRRMTSY